MTIEQKLEDALETLKRLVDLTPNRANAHNAMDLHHTVAAIAGCCIDRIEEGDYCEPLRSTS